MVLPADRMFVTVAICHTPLFSEDCVYLLHSTKHSSCDWSSCCPGGDSGAAVRESLPDNTTASIVSSNVAGTGDSSGSRAAAAAWSGCQDAEVTCSAGCHG